MKSLLFLLVASFIVTLVHADDDAKATPLEVFEAKLIKGLLLQNKKLREKHLEDELKEEKERQSEAREAEKKEIIDKEEKMLTRLLRQWSNFPSSSNLAGAWNLPNFNGGTINTPNGNIAIPSVGDVINGGTINTPNGNMDIPSVNDVINGGSINLPNGGNMDIPSIDDVINGGSINIPGNTNFPNHNNHDNINIPSDSIYFPSGTWEHYASAAEPVRLTVVCWTFMVIVAYFL